MLIDSNSATVSVIAVAPMVVPVTKSDDISVLDRSPLKPDPARMPPLNQGRTASAASSLS